MDRWKSRGGKSQRREEQKREEKESEERRCRFAKRYRKVARHCVFPMICGSGGSKSRLAKVAGAEPSGQMRDEKLHALHTVVTRSTCGSQNVQSTPFWDHFWKLRCRKMHAVVARSTFGSQNVQNTSCSDDFWKLRCWIGRFMEVEMSNKCTPVVVRSTFRSQKCKKLLVMEHFWTFRCRFAWQGQGINAPCQKWTKCEGFVAVSTTMAGVRRLKRICKDACRVAGAVQETRELDVLGDQGGDFLRWVAFWSMRSSGLGRWFCVTGAALRMTWHHFFVAGAVV